MATGYGRELATMMKVVDTLREDAPEMPAQQMQILLAVALQPGITSQALAKQVGVSGASISRNTNALGEWHRLGTPGLRLLEEASDPSERRRKIYFLTAKGRARVGRALSLFTGKPVDFTPNSAKDTILAMHRRSTEE